MVRHGHPFSIKPKSGWNGIVVLQSGDRGALSVVEEARGIVDTGSFQWRFPGTERCIEGMVCEGDSAIRCKPANQLGLVIHHVAIALFTYLDPMGGPGDRPEHPVYRRSEL